MAMNIDDLDFNDDDPIIQNINNDDGSQQPDFDSLDQEKPWLDGTEGGKSTNSSPAEPEPKQEPEIEEDIILSLLKSKGIEDPSKLKFENEEGEIEEVDWESLSNEEKLNILTSNDSDIDYGLDEEEQSLFNYLRTNGISPSEYIQYREQIAIENYKQSLEGNPQYEIDNITDDELYALDLESRVKDITKEEIDIALEQEKANPALFEKKMQGIRQEYKEAEDDRRQQEELLHQQERQEQFEEFQDGVMQALENLTEIGGVELNLGQEDLSEIADFILTSDAAGVSWLGKALDDPETLVRMAWFAIKGDEAFESLTEYYTKEITQQKREAYTAGYEDAKKGVQPRRNSKVVSKPVPKQDNDIPPTDVGKKTIDDIDF